MVSHEAPLTAGFGAELEATVQVINHSVITCTLNQLVVSTSAITWRIHCCHNQGQSPVAKT